MIAGANDISEKRSRWTTVATEFGYACARCHRTPAWDDADAYLLTGHCAKCWLTISNQDPEPGDPLTHL
jgi:hypothetical protein